MNMNHRPLILKPGGAVESWETRLIEKVAGMYDLNVSTHEIHTPDDFHVIASRQIHWGIVYTCGLGNVEYIEDPDGCRFYQWPEPSEALCNHLNEGAWFFLTCCHDDLDQVSYAMFYWCDDVRYVFAPERQEKPNLPASSVRPSLRKFNDREVELNRCASRTGEPIDLTIRVFDRCDEESTVALAWWCMDDLDLCSRIRATTP